MSEEFIRKVFNNFKIATSKVSFGGYIPPRVIGYAEKMDCNVIAWRSADQKRYLMYEKKTDIASANYAVPPLIWIFGNSLDLYAYKVWNGEKTELFYAPFYNVTKERVCLGTAASYIGDKKFFTFNDVIRTVEDAFFNSTFTHAGSEFNIAKSTLGYLAKTKDQEYFTAYDYLQPAGVTIADVCNSIFKSDV